MQINALGKQVVMISEEDVTAAETASGNVDTLGFDAAVIDIILGTVVASSNNASTFKLAECDTTVVTSFADITAFVGDGTGGWTIPAWDTANPTQIKFKVDLRGRMRYLKLSVAALTSQYVVATANLFRADQGPYNTSTCNVDALVEG